MVGSHAKCPAGWLSVVLGAVAAAIVVLTAASAAGADRIVLENSFSNERLGFSLRYPGSWECRPGKDGSSIWLSGKEDSAAYLVHLSVHSMATKAAGGEHDRAEALLAKFSANLKKQHPKARFSDLRKSDYAAGGVKAKVHLLEAEYARPHDEGRVPMKTMFFSVSPLHGRRIYALVYTAPIEYRGAKVFDANVPAVSAVVNSFKPTAPNGASAKPPSKPKPPAKKPVRVLVVGGDGKPLAGSGAVLLRGSGSFVEVGRDGEVTFDSIPAGTYEVMILWTGYATSNTKLEIRPGAASLIRMPAAAKEDSR